MKSSLILILTLLLFVSCGIQKREYNTVPNVSVKDDFLKDEITDSAFKSTEIVVEWWSEFNDPVLDRLIEKARQHNLDVNAAVAHFQASRAVLKKTKLDRLPTITARGDYTRTRVGENIFAPGQNPTYNSYNASLDSYWEIGAFGRVSNRIKGAYANSQQALA